MPLTHVCLWDDTGWKPISIKEATKIAPGKVSARSGLFMCELCGQFVSLAHGDTRDPYFKHSKDEDKDCPERSFGSIYTKRGLNKNTKRFPIRIKLQNNSSYMFQLGLTQLPSHLTNTISNANAIIKDSHYKVHTYNLRSDISKGITYLDLGNYPSQYYILKITSKKSVEEYWPVKINGISGDAVFEKKTGLLLPYDADVQVSIPYYVLTKKMLFCNSEYMQIKAVSIIGLYRLYEVKTLNFDEESAKFFLRLHCRLTDTPVHFYPLWPIFVKSPYIIYHQLNYMYGIIDGNVEFCTFPPAAISNESVNNDKSKFIRINCSKRQQLLSMGRLERVLDYEYLWADDQDYEDNRKLYRIENTEGEIVESINHLVKYHTINIILEFDGRFVIEKNGWQIKSYSIKAQNVFSFKEIEPNREYKIFVGQDCVWQCNTDNNVKYHINDLELLLRMKNCSGKLIPINHSFGAVAKYLKEYPLTRIWINQQIKKGYIQDDVINIITEMKEM